MQKVLLINPPLFFDKQGFAQSIDNSVPPLGLLYIASYIKKKSKTIKVDVLDITHNKTTLSEVVKIASNNEYIAVGISCMTPQLQGATKIATSIKTVNKDIKIFLGGPHISADPDFIKRNPNIFDYAISGEGEKTFLDSLNSLIAGEEIPQTQNGQILENLDDLRLDLDCLISDNKYNQAVSLLYSRGCPFNCYFCSRPAIDKHVRYMSVNSMINQIKSVINKSRGKIDFQDDTFTINRKKVVDLCEEIIKQKISLSWSCNTRIDLVDKELIELMKKAGCIHINFGIESGSQRVRQDVINKGNFTNERIFQVFKWCNKSKVKIACYFMIGHPTETKAELLESKEMILSSNIDILGLSIPTPFPGSVLWQIAEKEGVVSKQIIDDFAFGKLGAGYAGIYPVYISKELSADYVYKEMKDINIKFYLRLRILWSRLIEDIFSWQNLKKDITIFITLVKTGHSPRKPYK